MGVGSDLVAADQGGEDVVDGGAGDDFLYFGSTWSAGTRRSAARAVTAPA
jgi:hypothetical protein